MATVPSHPPSTSAEGRSRTLRLLVPEMWASLAIGVIWIVVSIDALFGPDIMAGSAGGDFSRIPSAIVLAFFAWLATAAIAKRGFGRRSSDTN